MTMSFLHIAVLSFAAAASAAATAAGGGGGGAASSTSQQPFTDGAADALRDLLRDMAEASSSGTRRSLSSFTSTSQIPIGIKSLIGHGSGGGGSGPLPMPPVIADIFANYGLMRGGLASFDNSTADSSGNDVGEGVSDARRRGLHQTVDDGDLTDMTTTEAQLQAAVAANTVGTRGCKTKCITPPPLSSQTWWCTAPTSRHPPPV